MKKAFSYTLITTAYIVFVVMSFIYDYSPGIEIGNNFVDFAKSMLTVLPCAFVLVGLFEVWVKRETVEKHLGEDAGIKAYFWTLLLSSTIVGGVLVALPLAFSLHKKNARPRIVFTFLGASTICRIPMTIFEASFIGIEFTAIKFAVSLPLVIASSIFLEKFLGKSYHINASKN